MLHYLQVTGYGKPFQFSRPALHIVRRLTLRMCVRIPRRAPDRAGGSVQHLSYDPECFELPPLLSRV
jgi:hypothetical protein